MWEDSQCAPGGKWSIRNLPKSHTNKFWEDLALTLIGDMFTNENEVLGILINLRPASDQIQVWHRNGKDQAKIDTLKSDLENTLKLEEQNIKLDYENFAESLAKFAQHKPAEGEARPANNNFQRGTYQRGGRGRGQ